MGGNRKHGFLRGNRGGFKPAKWTCDDCGRLKSGHDAKWGTLDGKIICNSCDNKRIKRSVTNG